MLFIVLVSSVGNFEYFKMIVTNSKYYVDKMNGQPLVRETSMLGSSKILT